MPALDTCLFGMATRAKRLKVAGVIGQFGVRPDRLDMIDFEAATAATGLATVSIAFEDFGPECLPALRSRDTFRKTMVLFPNAHSALLVVDRAHIHASLAFALG